MLNQAQIEGLLRDSAKLIGMWLVVKGIISEELLLPVVGLIIIVLGIVWSLFTNTYSHMITTVASATDSTKVIKEAMEANPEVETSLVDGVAASPQVKKVLAAPGLALATDSSKVVAAIGEGGGG